MKSITDYTDRELLELCADAVIHPSWAGNQAFKDGFLSTWNPLEDAGDRARMCDELMIDLNWHVAYVVAYSTPARDAHAERIRDHNSRTTAANYAAVRLVAMMELAKQENGE